MSGLRKWLIIALGAVVSLLLAVIVYVYAAGAIMLGRIYAATPSTLHATATPDAIARGSHLVRIFGCTDCHGDDLTGVNFDGVPPGTTLWSPNLRRLAQRYSDADFDRGVRQGLRADGTTLVIMPSNVYARLRDEDAAAIVFYLRSLPPRGEERPAREIGLIARAGLVFGIFQTTRGDFDGDKNRKAYDPGSKYEAGRYLAQNSCGQCHGMDLKGGPPYGPFAARPDLGLVAAYDRDDFRKFMRTGKAAGNRELPTMSRTSRQRFSHFTDAEVNALYDYLAARGNTLASSPQ